MTPLPTKGFFAIPVPEDAREFAIIEGNLLSFKAHFGPIPDVGRIRNLPPGSYQIVALSDEITEEQCKEICADIDSFRSLLKSLNISRAVIIKNQE